MANIHTHITLDEHRAAIHRATMASPFACSRLISLQSPYPLESSRRDLHSTLRSTALNISKIASNVEDILVILHVITGHCSRDGC